jgi:two-component system chemotaxis response regulator CheY
MAFNILLVDDSQTIRAVIKKAIRLAEVSINEIYEADNGRDALELLRRHWIDLVFADINMPVMTGAEMVSKMSEDGLLRSTPVVLVSVEGSETRVGELEAMGIRSFIRKPFTPERIRSVVEEILGSPVAVSYGGVVEKALGNVLESFAYMFSEMIPATDVPVSDGDHVRAEISFTGEISGSLVLIVPRGICPEIAANILGIESDADEAIADAEDALRELLNVTCGHLISTVAGTEAVLDMSLPTTRAIDLADWNDMRDDPETIAFLVDERPVLLHFECGRDGP